MRGLGILIAAVIPALTALPACTLITNFNTSSLRENSAALCSDGIDNDGNGLVDCEDWGCLNQKVCCTIPSVVLSDSFDTPACASASCDAPDASCPAINPDRWTAWGSPVPVVCDGALAFDKIQQCYDVGVISKAAFALSPGLKVEAGVIGKPEQAGRAEIGFTLQSQIIGSPDPCAPIDTARPALSIQVLADTGGYRFVARFDGTDVGVSPLETDGGAQHAVSVGIGDDRRVSYAVDGTVFAVSPAEEPIPGSGLKARLSLSGRGQTTRITDVRVTTGTQCESPAGWNKADPFVALDAATALAAWDTQSVGAPALVRSGSGLDLYYTGCATRLGACDPGSAGVGRAHADTGLLFRRTDNCPIIGTAATLCSGGLPNPFADQFNNLIDVGIIDAGNNVRVLASEESRGRQLIALSVGASGSVKVADQPGGRIQAGPMGAWDGYDVCCASAVVADDGEIRVYYSGRSGPDQPWQIGLAESTDGVLFTKWDANPIVAQGAPGSFDDRGALAPSVLRERGLYRMWYEAQGTLGVSSIGYAVSEDGVTWHKFPGNPVVSPAGVGLMSVGRPDVVTGDDGDIMLIEGQASDRPGSRIYALTNGGRAFGQSGAAAPDAGLAAADAGLPAADASLPAADAGAAAADADAP